MQVLQDLFFKFYCMFYFTCDRSFIEVHDEPDSDVDCDRL